MEDNNSNQNKTITSEMEKHKNNIIVILQNTNATPFQRHSDIAFACCFCKNQYLNPKELKAHTLNDHNESEIKEICKRKNLRYYLMKLDVTDLVCNICNEGISTPQGLFEHLEGHGKKIYTDMGSRIIPFRFNTEKHECAICSEVFCKFKNLREHLNIHFKNYVCKFCDTGFITLGLLASHEASHNFGTFQCDYCDKRFYTCKSKKIHERLLHRDKIEEKLMTQDEDNDKESDNKAIDQAKVEADSSANLGVIRLHKMEKEKHHDNILVVLENTNATPFGKCTDTGYDCLLCTQKFFHPKDLKEHKLTTHTTDEFLSLCKQERLRSYIVKLDITGLLCKICNNRVESWDNLFEHLENHGKFIHRDINNHIIPFVFDSDNPLQVCAICAIAFHKVKLLREHMNTHFPNYICDVCNAAFITERMLSAHIQCHKTGVFKCGLCEKSFKTYRSRRAHEYMVHVKSNHASRCGFCKKTFKSYAHKTEHLKTVPGVILNELRCSVCDRTFKSQPLLTTHVKRDHLMERHYKCNECEKTFFNKIYLKSHMVTHTGIRNFECEVCKKTFAWSKILKKHMRAHMDDRSFKCNRCEKAFVQKLNWQNHMRKKHNEEVS
ncbi:zinc finger protein 845-like [Pararge aegeria]|uniref:zinc finger protein 845-like n=1 Tax=Pararge aegeria TaxID=116150 RepID=UPI0019D0F46E|nr:zinc finger protein 845-like [Pararge aegeria]